MGANAGGDQVAAIPGDGDPDLELVDLRVEVPRGQALAQQLQTVHLGLDAASAVVSIPFEFCEINGSRLWVCFCCASVAFCSFRFVPERFHFFQARRP